MRFFFIDLENVRSEGLEGVSSLGDTDTVFIYYSENAMNLSIPTLENLNNSRSSKKFIKTNYIGKNAMDFQIVSLFGAMIERNKGGSYYIISQDNGFRSAVSFCESYFEDYRIRCGVYPTIISAITAEMKSAPKAGGEETQDSAKKKRRRRKKNQTAKEENTGVQTEEAKEVTEEAADTVKENAAVRGKEAQEAPKNQKPPANSPEGRLGYIYTILKEFLSEKTIGLYAEAIDEAIAKCKNRNELHDFYHSRFGDDEGEALYKITQGDFEKMKQARPSKPSRTHRRPKKNPSANNQTVS